MLQVNNISFHYNKTRATLKDIDFSLHEGEHLSIMGESGCGKSTLLKIIYGLLDLDCGTIFWKDQQVLGPAYYLVPGMEFFKYVAQDFDLMPYTTVRENIAKFLSRFYPDKARERTDELLDVIEMSEFSEVKVKSLSGGQQQRVAIARALAKEPELLLLDEPFSQIDNFKKNTLRRKLFAYLKNKNITCIVATHDGRDALSFADKMIVLKDHKIIAMDTPIRLYQHPKEKYIAALFDDVNEVVFDQQKYLFFPHQIRVTEESGTKAVVLDSYFKGYSWLIEAKVADQVIFFSHHCDLTPKKTVSLIFDNETVLF